jgi:hypothetical protein
MNSPLGATATLIDERSIKPAGFAQLGVSVALYETNSSPGGDIYGRQERQVQQLNPIERDQPEATGPDRHAPSDRAPVG